jgi:excisionase family DNA binding protein
MNDPLEEYTDALGASSRLSIHPESVKRLIRQGKLPAMKVANKWFIRRDELEQFATRYDPRPGRKATLI